MKIRIFIVAIALFFFGGLKAQTQEEMEFFEKTVNNYLVRVVKTLGDGLEREMKELSIIKRDKEETKVLFHSMRIDISEEKNDRIVVIHLPPVAWRGYHNPGVSYHFEIWITDEGGDADLRGKNDKVYMLWSNEFHITHPPYVVIKESGRVWINPSGFSLMSSEREIKCNVEEILKIYQNFLKSLYHVTH